MVDPLREIRIVHLSNVMVERLVVHTEHLQARLDVSD